MRSGIIKNHTACLVLALLLAVACRLAAQPAPPAAGAPASAHDVSIGIYISSIFDIYPEQSSFFADFAVWTTQKGDRFNPLDNIVFPNARNYESVYKSYRMVNGVQWSLRRYRGTFFHEWTLRNFPFDKHRLKIRLFDTDPESNEVHYVADTKCSGLASHFDLVSWSVSDFRITVDDVQSETTLGNPAPDGKPQTYSWITATVLVKRDAPWVFLKLVMGGYVALATAMIGCLMKTSVPPVFSGRMILQISSLFAALLSNRATDFILGRVDQFTLPNLIHALIYFMIFAGMIITLRSRFLCDNGKEVEAIKFERRTTLALVLLFIILNIALIWHAALSPILDT